MPCLSFDDHEGADRGAGDHDHLVRQRVQDDLDLAAGEDIAAEDHHEDDDDADDPDHCSIHVPARRGRRAIPLPLGLAAGHLTKPHCTGTPWLRLAMVSVTA